MKFPVFWFLVLIQFFATGQSSLTQILSSPVDDQDYLIALKQQQYIENHKFNSPWLRELEFRFRSEDRQLDIEEYRMRLGLINPLEILANRKYKQLIAEYNEAEKASIINDVLQRRYELLIEYFYLDSRLELTKGFIQRKQKQQQIRIDLNPNLDKIVDLELSILKAQISLVDLENKQNLVTEEIFDFAGSLPDGSAFERLITPDLIMMRVDTAIDESQILTDKQLDLAIKEQLLRIDRAESWSNIGYVQGDYDITNGDVFADHLSFQMGVTLPVFNTDRPKLQRDELKLIDDRVKNDLLLDRTKNRLLILSKKLSSAYQQYKLVLESEGKLQKWKQISEDLTADQGTYNELVSFEEFVSNRLLELHGEMLNLYIAFLHEKSELNGSNPVNQIIDQVEPLNLPNQN